MSLPLTKGKFHLVFTTDREGKRTAVNIVTDAERLISVTEGNRSGQQTGYVTNSLPIRIESMERLLQGGGAEIRPRDAKGLYFVEVSGGASGTFVMSHCLTLGEARRTSKSFNWINEFSAVRSVVKAYDGREVPPAKAKRKAVSA